MRITINIKPLDYFPEGLHEVFISDVQDGLSSQKGVPFFAVYFQNDSYKSEKRFYYESGNSHVIIGKLFEACGIISENSQGEFSLDTTDLKGKRLKISVKIKTYNDVSYSDVVYFEKLGESVTMSNSDSSLSQEYDAGDDLPF